MLRSTLKLNLDRDITPGKGVFLYRCEPRIVRGQEGQGNLCMQEKRKWENEGDEIQTPYRPMQNRSYIENRYLYTAPNAQALQEAYELQLQEEKEKEKKQQRGKGRNEQGGGDENEIQKKVKLEERRKEKRKKMKPPTYQQMIQYVRDMVTFTNSSEQSSFRKNNVFPVLTAAGVYKEEESDSDSEPDIGEETKAAGVKRKHAQALGDMLLLENTRHSHRRHILERSLKATDKGGKRSFKKIKRK